jgi:glutaredoxin 3
LQLTIYTTSTCPYCKMLKEYLTQKNIPFTEKMIDQDENARDEMTNYSGGFLGVPFTMVVKDDGNRETIVGFDKGRLNSILQINQ